MFCFMVEYTSRFLEHKDTEIFQQLQSGHSAVQEKAFRYLYQNYFGLVESLIVSNKGTKEDAADIFHDGLIVLFHQVKAGKFREGSSLKTYLYSICRNLWLMKLRRQKKEIRLEEKHENMLVEDHIFQTLEQTERKKLLVKILGELKEGCRQILDLYYFQKMKMRQIRQHLNLASDQVAKNKKSRCMQHLRTKVMQNPFYQNMLRH